MRSCIFYRSVFLFENRAWHFVILFLIFILDFAKFSHEAFLSSQHFLQSFGFIGLNYAGASVVICVVFPFVVFVTFFGGMWTSNKKNLRKSGTFETQK